MRYAERHAYSLSNPFTSKAEKIEIECWYQLPFTVSAWWLILACFLWSRGTLTFWTVALLTAVIATFLPIVALRFYSKRVNQILSMTLGFPFVLGTASLTSAAYLFYSGHWPAACTLVANTILLTLPSGFPSIVVNGLLLARYDMHPKYALLQHLYRKTYAFERSDSDPSGDSAGS